MKKVRLRSRLDPQAGSGKQRDRQEAADLEWFAHALDVLITKAAKRQLCPVCVLITLGRAKQFVHGDLLAQGASDDDICRWLAAHGIALPPEIDALADDFVEAVNPVLGKSRCVH